MNNSISVFWFRRDLRLDDNHGLYIALSENKNVLPIFIFDDNILNKLPKDDRRVTYIWEELDKINQILQKYKSKIHIFKGNPIEVFRKLFLDNNIEKVYANKDFEPYGIERDLNICNLCSKHNIAFNEYIDHVIFEPGRVLKADGLPYTVYTPFKNKWLAIFSTDLLVSYPSENHLTNLNQSMHSKDTVEWSDLGFTTNSPTILGFDDSIVKHYDTTRDFPSLPTTHIGTHLRFGTLSIRKIVKKAHLLNATFLSELIWREFFMQILYFFPHVAENSFRKKYDSIDWLNNEDEYKYWTNGNTGYPIVDAGMRELNETGLMHNRVRMICASFLCKHLLIDWRWGEHYFAEKLLDFELASNNGNWQWAAGTGCDAAPYFRVFNPTTQSIKFDKKNEYISKWVPEFMELDYQKPIVEHKFARERAIQTYKEGLAKYI